MTGIIFSSFFFCAALRFLLFAAAFVVDVEAEVEVVVGVEVVWSCC